MFQKRFCLIHCIAMYLSCSLLIAASVHSNEFAEGQLLKPVIHSPSLTGNMWEISDEQPLAIYLPPSYKNSNQRYPVVYYLPGWSSLLLYYTDWKVFQGFDLKSTLDQLINDQKIDEMIVVIPNANFFAQGAFSVNSPIWGNWEHFITEDVVSYIDQNFRTIRAAKCRGIAGHSMGGYAAIHLAMKQPELFGSVYALCPGLAKPNGLLQHRMFKPENIELFLKLQKKLRHLPAETAKLKLIAEVNDYFNVYGNYEMAFAVAYGGAFAWDLSRPAPFIDYPYLKNKHGDVVFNKRAWQRWEQGFGNLQKKVCLYQDNLNQLYGIVLDYGTEDTHSWIPEGTVYFAELLEKAHINHQLLRFEGGHSDRVGDRLTEIMLPTFSLLFSSK